MLDTQYNGKPTHYHRNSRNIAKCRKCGDIIESKSRHDFVTCGCGAIAVDGGYDYNRRIGNPNDFEEVV